MKWFSNLKIRIKLIICFIILACFTGLVGYIGIYNMSKINSRGVAMYEHNFIPAQQLSDVQRNLLYIRSDYLLLLYEKDMTKFQERLDEINQYADQNSEALTDYEKTIASDEERTIFNKVVESLDAYTDIRNAHIELIRDQNFEEADAKISEFTKAREILENELIALIDYNKQTAKDSSDLNARDYKSQSILMVGIIVAGIVLAISLGVIIAYVISKPISQLLGAARRIADGDLDITMDNSSKDEVGELATAFRKMVDNLNEVLTNINVSAEQVASGSRQVSDSSMALSQGATEQASSVEQLTASLEEIAAQTKQNADNANKANSLAEIAKGNAEQGNSQMNDMLKAMDEINDSSSNIYKIIKVIDEIAFQTNILALNAAVEAARAGQHGKGFAVVAEEVRNLAARSASAAKETTEMIEGSIKKVEGGTKIANQTADALNKIVENITSVSALVGDIAVASTEQASGISQINQGIMQVSEVVQTNSATSQESAAASEELSSQADVLKNQVAKFKIRKAHRASAAYGGMEDLNPEVIKMLEEMSENKKSNRNYGNDEFSDGSANVKRIVLSDKEFGKY
jgi:methyl-accepting chemotaxis protein